MSSLEAAETPALRRYYRWHARIYDATRWSFLFGREALTRSVAQGMPPPRRVLEIGCGTGRNLACLAQRLPNTELVGVDLSADMLRQAAHRLAPFATRCQLHQGRFPSSVPELGRFDAVIAAYTLSMVGHDLDALLAAMTAHLNPGGELAIVDFQSTPIAAWRRWMALNHVHLEDRLRPRLRALGTLLQEESHTAYAGVWRWFLWRVRV